MGVRRLRGDSPLLRRVQVPRPPHVRDPPRGDRALRVGVPPARPAAGRVVSGRVRELASIHRGSPEPQGNRRDARVRRVEEGAGRGREVGNRRRDARRAADGHLRHSDCLEPAYARDVERWGDPGLVRAPQPRRRARERRAFRDVRFVRDSVPRAHRHRLASRRIEPRRRARVRLHLCRLVRRRQKGDRARRSRRGGSRHRRRRDGDRLRSPDARAELHIWRGAFGRVVSRPRHLVPRRVPAVPARVPRRLAFALRTHYRRLDRHPRLDLLLVANVDPPRDMRRVRVGVRRSRREDGRFAHGGGHSRACGRRHAREDVRRAAAARLVACDSHQPLQRPAQAREASSPAEA